MSIDTRTRMYKDVRELSCDEVFDSVLPEAVALRGDLAARGVTYRELPTLGLEADGRGITLGTRDGELTISAGTDGAGVVAVLEAQALSDLVQDTASHMGLAMTSKVRIIAGSLDDWISWEPPLRALFDGRPVHESGAILPRDPDGQPLDLTRSFGLDDDRAEVAHFLEEAGFLYLRDVFDQAEMAAVSIDIDKWIAKAEPDDGASWWAEDSAGTNQAVRVLWFHEKSEALAKLLYDERLGWLAGLTGDDLDGDTMTAEGLVKPLDIVNGLSDLPWHKDCGQGHHSYMCSGLTAGISVTGADRNSGALGVIPGSHRANTTAAMRDPKLDLQPLMLETRTGDVTVHCSDTLHRAHPPVDQPRQVVYTSFQQRLQPGDRLPERPAEESRAERARLTNVRQRIEAADNPEATTRFQANPASSPA
jgi:hypothetical protein